MITNVTATLPPESEILAFGMVRSLAEMAFNSPNSHMVRFLFIRRNIRTFPTKSPTLLVVALASLSFGSPVSSSSTTTQNTETFFPQGKARYPKNAKEWAELDHAAALGPRACEDWLYQGSNNLFSKLATGRTWANYRESDPIKGCRREAENARGLAEDSLIAPLGNLQRALSEYYMRAKGHYPIQVDQIVPRYIAQIPAIEIPEYHPLSSQVHYFQSFAPDDSGGWGYISNEKNKDFGKIFINCTHRDSRGRHYYDR